MTRHTVPCPMPFDDHAINPHTWDDYTEVAQGLLLALADIQHDCGGRFVKCSRVIQRFLESHNRLTESAESAIKDERIHDHDVEAAYQVLLGLYRDHSGYRMIDGHGNFGTPSRGFPAASPHYTEISLTERGKQMVCENQL